jgi:hypothetical protein
MQVLSPQRESAQVASVTSRTLVRASRAAAVWAFLYAAHRAYYAAGGTFGMFGVPVSEAQWRFVNAVGAAMLLVVATAPLAMLDAWRRPALRYLLPTLCWLLTVGFVMHAVIDMTQRLLSLTGLMTMDVPFWLSVDRRQSDLQDLLFNEPWFLIEGLLWGTIAWAGGLSRMRNPRWWLTSALVAILGLTIVGLLAATGVIGKLIVG